MCSVPLPMLYSHCNQALWHLGKCQYWPTKRKRNAWSYLIPAGCTSTYTYWLSSAPVSLFKPKGSGPPVTHFLWYGRGVYFLLFSSKTTPLCSALWCWVWICKLCFWETFARWLPISWWTVSGENWREIGRWKEVEGLFLFLVLMSLQEKQQQSTAMASVPSFICHSPIQLRCSLLKVPAPASHTLPEFWAPACTWGPLLTSSRPFLFSFVPITFDS